MFQSNVFLKDPSDYRRVGKGARYSEEIINIQEVPNLLLLAEGDGVTATSLGQRPSRGGIIIREFEVIHRAPSVEGVTATSLGNLKVTKNYIKINRKNAPNGLSHCSNQTNKEV